jgi:hypothetical protein
MLAFLKGYKDVARDLAEGLEDGSVALDTRRHAPRHSRLGLKLLLVAVVMFDIGVGAYLWRWPSAFFAFLFGTALGALHAPMFLRLLHDDPSQESIVAG